MDGAEAAAAMLRLVAMGVMVVTTMVTTPMEETTTVATTVATVALPQASMEMVAMEATLLVVSVETVTSAASMGLGARHPLNMFHSIMLYWNMCDSKTFILTCFKKKIHQQILN